MNSPPSRLDKMALSRICGDLKKDDTFVKGKTPEGSNITVNKSDIVTIETNGVCKK